MASKRELILEKRLRQLQLQGCFDPNDFDSRPTDQQDKIFRDIVSRVVVVRAGNQSGKTATGGKIAVMKFLEDHPYWKRDPEWGSEALSIVVSSTGHQQLVDIWEQKLAPFLDASKIKIEREKGYLKRVINKENGNKLIFIPHNVDAQQKTQGLVCHHFWIDEMPKDKAFVDEALERVQSKKGQLVMTFTPTVVNEEIREFCDMMPLALGKTYILNRLQNPVYADRVEELLAQYAGLPDKIRRMRLHGDWVKPDGAVFNLNRKKKCFRELPQHYSKTGWDHYFGIDPAYRGYTGYCIIAIDPQNGDQWVVRSDYIEGQAASILVQQAENLIAGYNIVKRIYDSHETVFWKEAALHKIFYQGVHKKTSRKAQLIRQLQEHVEEKDFYIYSPKNQEFLRELESAQWSETSNGKIKNSTRFHILDAVQYVIDKIPKFVPPKGGRPKESYTDMLARRHEEELSRKEKAYQKRRIKQSRRRRR